MEAKPKVLFVDDEAPIINTLKRVFKGDEVEAYFVESGEAAHEVLNKNDISVIVTDYRMPDVDGLTLLRFVKERYPDTMRIILTGYPDMGLLLDAVNEVGIFRVLLKPWRNEELRHAVQQAIEYRQVLLRNRELVELTRRQNRELREINAKLLELVEEKTREWIEIKEKLIQMDKLSMLGFMTGVVAHEINNPLTAILAITEMSMKSVDRESEVYRDLKEIESAARRCREIVERYLKFTRVSREEEMSMISIRDVINNAVNMMKPLLLKKNQNIQVAITDVPVIKGNFNRLLQVFLNLISNSMDAMVEGGNIHISTGVDDDSVLVTVSDDGPGIPEELREKIFSPFFTTKQNGTGLGLSIVEEIIREHGGKIKLQDSKKGATFVIQLPCMEGAYADQKSAYS